MFCSNCGKEIRDGGAFCKYCGAKIEETTKAKPVTPKKEDKELVVKDSSNYNRLVALILCIFLGDFGAHDFYVGRTMFGAIKLGATILGAISAFVGVGLILILGVTAWVIYDIVMIASGKYTDKYNLPLKKWDSE